MHRFVLHTTRRTGLTTNTIFSQNTNQIIHSISTTQQLRFAGHNKWSKIRHKKKDTDAEKLKVYGRASREITTSIREGGGDTDPSSNLRLRLILDKARKLNVPKHVIQNAINSASAKDGVTMERIYYEGSGPSGVGFVIESLTDKRTRTAQNLRVIFTKNNGTMEGARTMWAFTQKGSVVCNFFIPRDKVTKTTQEDLEMELMSLLEDEEYEVEQIDHSDSDDVHLAPLVEYKITVLTTPKAVNELNKVLTTQFTGSQDLKNKLHVQKAESDMNFIVYHPNSYISISDEEATLSLLKIIELLDDDDDVVAVYHNAKFVDDA